MLQRLGENMASIGGLLGSQVRSRHGLGYGHNQLLKIVLGVKFTDGIEEFRSQAQAAAA